MKQAAFHCFQCGRQLSSKHALKRHEQLHTDERPFECTSCDSTFKTPDNLRKHVNRLHGTSGNAIAGNPRRSLRLQLKSSRNQGKYSPREASAGDQRPIFSCIFCEKMFGTKRSLNLHIRVHLGEQPFCCSSCDKTFKLKFNADRHMQNVHGAARKKGKANVQRKSKHQVGHLVNPRRMGSPRLFRCQECGKDFKSAKCLKRHQVIHREERPFVCGCCNASFKRRDALVAHTKRQHGNCQANEATTKKRDNSPILTRLRKRDNNGNVESSRKAKCTCCSSNHENHNHRTRRGEKEVKVLRMTGGRNRQSEVAQERSQLDLTPRQRNRDCGDQGITTPAAKSVPGTSKGFNSNKMSGRTDKSKLDMELRVQLYPLATERMNPRSQSTVNDEASEVAPEAQPEVSKTITSARKKKTSGFEGQLNRTRSERWAKRHPPERQTLATPSCPRYEESAEQEFKRLNTAFQKRFWNNYFREVQKYAPDSINPDYQGDLMNADCEPYHFQPSSMNCCNNEVNNNEPVHN